MARFSRFEEIQSWKKGHELVLKIYAISNQALFRKDFGLRDQIRRAGVSIVSNIAEGCDRNGNREFVQFLSLAKGSAAEVRAQLYIARDLGYLPHEACTELSALTEEISRLIGGLMTYLQDSPFKGPKTK